MLWRAEQISGLAWLFLTGLGSYLAYVPYNTLLFDRLIATTGVAGTAVFAIYLADALGYTGSVLIQVLKDVVVAEEERAAFLATCAMAISVTGCLPVLGSALYFLRHRTRVEASKESAVNVIGNVPISGTDARAALRAPEPSA